MLGQEKVPESPNVSLFTCFGGVDFKTRELLRLLIQTLMLSLRRNRGARHAGETTVGVRVWQIAAPLLERRPFVDVASSIAKITTP